MLHLQLELNNVTRSISIAWTFANVAWLIHLYLISWHRAKSTIFIDWSHVEITWTNIHIFVIQWNFFCLWWRFQRKKFWDLNMLLFNDKLNVISSWIFNFWSDFARIVVYTCNRLGLLSKWLKSQAREENIKKKKIQLQIQHLARTYQNIIVFCSKAKIEYKITKMPTF